MSLSPMMQQYHRAKEAAGDALLLFRMGDFYELFYEDAQDAGRLLGVTVTTRDKDKGDKAVPMAGFPHHQLDAYLAKILRAGRRAAVCDQVEDAMQAKGLVRRELTRIVTPGAVTDDGLLDPTASNYLAAVAIEGAPSQESPVGLAWVDVSTGRFHAATLAWRRLADELARIEASECLVAGEHETLLPMALDEGPAITVRTKSTFSPKGAVRTLHEHFGAPALEGFGFDERRPGDLLALRAAGAVLDYLRETQKASLPHLERLTPHSEGDTLEIDAATWRSLEVTQTLRDGRREGALLGVLDRTTTAPGARLLGDWLRSPLTSTGRINARLDAVGELLASEPLCGALRGALKGVYDLERLVARIVTGRSSPRDLSCVARTLATLPALKARLAGRSSERLAQVESRIDLCPDLRAALEQALEEDCPLNSREGGYVRAGYSPELDECRELMAGGKQWMARYQAEQTERTGIPSIKVGFNKVFGYYLEVTHAHRDKVPQEFIRKQTLKNAERYITPELKEYEERVLSAEDRATALEYDIFLRLREQAAGAASRLLGTASALAELDVLAGLAELARSRGYCRPEVIDEPILDIAEGRHPVLDVMLPEGTFVPNDCHCAAIEGSGVGGQGSGTKSLRPPTSDLSSLLLLTGPNMAGKSTYIRQTALLLLMAQIGSFIPASSARIGVADKLFARVGASDDVSRGQSTFMVEMTETARILNNATRRSLVILDEIGRGTSTYDGLSLAWAIAEHLHNTIQCRSFFATHYHELTELADTLRCVGNLNVAVREHEGKVVFLHQIVAGPADKSYGIHVAHLAGVPRTVNERAEAILAELESERPDSARHAPAAGLQLTLFETSEHPLVDELRRLDLNRTTPLEAMQLLQEWKQQVLNERR